MDALVLGCAKEFVCQHRVMAAGVGPHRYK